MQKHIFKGTEKIKKNYGVVFKIWGKKKVDRPSHPSHPSVNIKNGGVKKRDKPYEFLKSKK